jgi:calcineurin-like phosphoesterase family protein
VYPKPWRSTRRRYLAGPAILVMAAVAVSAPGSSSPQPSAASAAAITTTVSVAEDTYISTSNPNTPFGSDTKIVTCGNDTPVCAVDNANEKRGLLKFNVSGLTGTVTTVKLRYAVSTTSVPALKIQKLTTNGWAQGTVTWNNGGSSLPAGPTVYTGTSGAAAGWYEADVTGAVTGNGTYSFVVLNPTGSTTRLTPKELNAANAPQLVITTHTNATPDIVLDAAGDISTRTKTGGNKLTSDLVLSLNPDHVLTMGDNQYDNGALADFQAYFNSTWGRFKSKIHPSPGHHDYYTDANAAGYYTYFGAAATPRNPMCTSGCEGYYSFDLGNWHLIALNTNHHNCAYVACGPGSAQVNWLAADLAANTKPCVLAYWADPRWSSGTKHGSNRAVDAIWDALSAARVDIALNGHEHFYERFAKQNSDGAATADGIRQFTVGTGGNAPLYPFGTPIANSEVRDNSTRGVLQMTLHANSYHWSFKPIPGGSFTDSGTGTCN